MSNDNGNGNGNNGFVKGLWQEFFKTGNVEPRNRLVEHYLSIASGAAARASKRLPVDYDDLFQMAVMGLMTAVQAFDPNRGAKFETFASHRVNGAIIDALRKQDWASRTWRHRRRELMRAREAFLAAHDREPTTGELAKELGLPETKIQKLLLGRGLDTVSLNLVDQDGDQLIQPAGKEDEVEKLLAESEAIRQQLHELNDVEQTVILMYFEEGFPMFQIGELLNLSESRVSQIITGVILFLRRKLTQETISA